MSLLIDRLMKIHDLLSQNTIKEEENDFFKEQLLNFCVDDTAYYIQRQLFDLGRTDYLKERLLYERPYCQYSFLELVDEVTDKLLSELESAGLYEELVGDEDEDRVLGHYLVDRKWIQLIQLVEDFLGKVKVAK